MAEARRGVMLSSALLLLAWFVAPGEGAGSFLAPPQCRSDLFFDTAGQFCNGCNNNAEPNPATAGGGYAATECVCEDGFALSYAEPASEEALDLGTCLQCPTLTVPSASNDYCVRCDASSGDGWSPARINGAGDACECTTTGQNRVISQYGLGGALLRSDDGTFMHRCVECEEGSRPDAGSLACVPCTYPKTWNGQRCTCPETLPEGSRCALTEEAWIELVGRGAASFEMTFADVPQSDGSLRDITVDRSAVMTDLLESSTSLCFEQGNTTACNALGNLCTLQMHDETAPACVLYRELVDLRRDEEYHEDQLLNVGWSVTLPWLYYPRGQANVYLSSTDINSRVKLEGSNEVVSGGPLVRTLSFKVARYALGGQFLGWKNFTSLLQICGAPVVDRDIWSNFGTNYKNDCEVPLTTILDIGDSTSQPEFVDLYFEDGANRMFPVPLILENTDSNEQALLNENINAVQLTRRFFLVDTLSGLQSTAGPNSVPAAVRYLEKLSLEVVLQPINSAGGPNGRIYPPRARLRYAARDPGLRYESRVVNPAEFRVTYSESEEKLQRFIQAWDILIITAMFLAIVIGFVKIFRFAKNQRGSGGDNSGEMALFTEFVVVGLDVGSAACFFILFGICIYWVCFFKLQSTVYRMLPMDEGDIWYRFRVSVICTTVGRVATVLWMIWKQTSVDIFLIDWTEPIKYVDDKEDSVGIAKVSCWRSLFIANEWNELQTLRVTSLEVTMFTVVFLLSGLGIENGAKIKPDSWDIFYRPTEETSQLLRFGISSSLFVLVQIVQYLFVKLVNFKISSPIRDFVDLLWLSNISMFVLDGVSGYYLHGQFSGSYVDTDAVGLNDVLLGTQGKRGLIDDEDTQTFMVFLSDDLRTAYDGFRRSVNDKYNRQREDSIVNYALRGPKDAGADKQLRKECDKVRERFMEELGEIKSSQSSHVRDPNYLSKWTKIPPDDSISKTIFWKDAYNSFTDVLFYGNELSLFMMQVMVFTCIDMRLRNAAFSGAITYMIMRTVGYLRTEWGKNNLSQKSMIDKKFLI